MASTYNYNIHKTDLGWVIFRHRGIEPDTRASKSEYWTGTDFVNGLKNAKVYFTSDDAESALVLAKIKGKKPS